MVSDEKDSHTNQSKYRGYEPVIGLEIHAQLKTDSKMFCADATNFDAGDNENTSPLSIGMPGTLPTINKRAVEYSIKAGLAFNCTIRKKSVFARKNYFYPDLSKGYQISQYDEPICENGTIEFFVEGRKIKIGIVRAHIEEDAGKSTHHGNYSLINYNRAGIPLLEIVSQPELHSPQEAAEYARTVRAILRYLEVCDGNLEEGSLRCDCNVSVRKIGEKQLGTKIEIKNINSFRFVEKALEYEIQRQIDCLETGQRLFQETRLFDSAKNKTYVMRTKEDADDYRYFPDPDLLPLIVSQEWIDHIQKTLPELPLARSERFCRDYKLLESESFNLTQEKEIADYFEEVVRASENAKAASNWIMGELTKELNESHKLFCENLIRPEQLGELIKLVDSQTISGKIAKTVFGKMWLTGKSPQELLNELGLVQISDANIIEKIIDEILQLHPHELNEYKSGKTKVFGFLVGQIMRRSKGQANPSIVNELLKKKLEE